MRGLPRHRDLRLLLGAQSASTIGGRLVFVALAPYVTDIGTPSDVGIVRACHAVPLVGFRLIGGVWADRLPRRARLAQERDRVRGAGSGADLARGMEPQLEGSRSVPVTSTTTSPPTRTRPSSTCASSRLGRPISTPWVTSRRSSPMRSLR